MSSVGPNQCIHNSGLCHFIIFDCLLTRLLKHAERVLEILQLKNPTESETNDMSEDRVEFEDQIDGVVYCDYTSPKFESKPDPEFYRKVMHSFCYSRTVDAHCFAYTGVNTGKCHGPVQMLIRRRQSN
jgi:hypothetical protein